MSLAFALHVDRKATAAQLLPLQLLPLFQRPTQVIRGHDAQAASVVLVVCVAVGPSLAQITFSRSWVPQGKRSGVAEALMAPEELAHMGESCHGAYVDALNQVASLVNDLTRTAHEAITVDARVLSPKPNILPSFKQRRSSVAQAFKERLPYKIRESTDNTSWLCHGSQRL
ncbi:uncharacterized protein LOC119586606 [Penaeus monodon]|uniref:uncharacterized protein LOC119586606 n=1 Tax=Penaeus monodon TaxID=6687 RepID=UPI0018A79F92|nr:uncharacterized protein LOC119586606 [Penaeus monodon]